MTGYRVRNWDQFQQYKDRSPPGIRLHRRILDDYDFHMTPPTSRALAPMLWLLARDNPDPSSGVIEGPDERIAFRLRTSARDFATAVKPLIDKGYIEPVHAASGSLAGHEHEATPETEAEREETESDAGARGVARLDSHRTLAVMAGTANCQARAQHRQG